MRSCSQDSGSLHQFRDLATTLKAAEPAMHKAAASDVAYTTAVPQTNDEQDDMQWTQ